MHDSFRKFTAVDLFAGGGGLSVGLTGAGFDVLSAVENEPVAASIYAANHARTTVLQKDIREIAASDLVPAEAAGREVDLIAGCPPCQGYSSLTAKHHRSDLRDALIREFLRVVRDLRPRAVMLENVPRLAVQGRFLFEEFIEGIGSLGYDVNWGVLQVADFGVPQKRRRLVLLAGRDGSIDLPVPTHARAGKNDRLPWRTVRDALPSSSEEPCTLTAARAAGGPATKNWHVVRNMSRLNLKRLETLEEGQSWPDLPKRLRSACHTSKGGGFSNVYGRMRWDAPAPTITGGCTTFSKGRFGHPVKNRTISVREAATLQEFPRDYNFNSDFMEHVCNVIGNALPCGFAQLVSTAVATHLKDAGH